jgi:hypothetical protein
MLLERNKYREFGFIGDELPSDPGKEHLHKCMVAEQTIAAGDFSLDEALEAYGLTKEEYESYVADKSNANIFTSLSGNTSDYFMVKMIFSTPSYFEIFAKMLENATGEQTPKEYHACIMRITNDLHGLSKDIKKLKEKA